MSTSDLRSGSGLISGPTGFVHVSGFSRHGRCSSISGSASSEAEATASTSNSNPLREYNSQTSRGRTRELANIDPKFTSQVRRCRMYSSDFYPQPRNPAESTRLVVESLSKISPQLEGNDLHALFQTWFYRWLLIDTLFWVDCGYISFGKMPPFKPFHLQHLEKQNESRNFLNLKYCLLVLDWA